jgi:adenosylcobinamide-GDP ribazoletransferase
VRGFLFALQFLTIAPVLIRRPIGPEELGRSMRWFPAVGALLGCVIALVDWLLAPITTPEIRSVAAVTLLAVLTGALHLDGLMDACDALFALATPARRLEIMADSRVGSFGLVGAALTLLLKFAAILSLPAFARPEGFIAMGALSRWAMVYATVQFPAARTTGLGSSYKAAAGRIELVIATTLAVLALTVAGVAGAGALLIAWAVATACARYACARIGGLNGDVYGAISEVVEVAVVIVLPPLWRFVGAPLAV